MSIGRMIPRGAVQRTCVCGYPIFAKTDELTVHELKCLGLWPIAEPEQSKTEGEE